MRFQEDPNSKTAIRVQVVDKSFETSQKLNLDSVTFSPLEKASCPILEAATDSSVDIEDILETMNDDEVCSLYRNLEPYLIRLSAHSVGHQLVVALAAILPEILVEDLARKISDNFMKLSETAAGAVCVLEILGKIPSNLQCLILENYVELQEDDGPMMISHMTGHHSQLVFQACLCLLGPTSIRPLLSITVQTLSSVSRHKSMISLIKHLARIDPPSLFIIANGLEKINCLFEEEYRDLVNCLICHGGTIFTKIHHVSGIYELI